MTSENTRSSPIAHPHHAHHLPGMVYAIFGYGVMTIFDTLLKSASRHGYPQTQMMVTVGAAFATTVVVMALLSGGVKRLKTRKLPFHLLRGYLSLIGFFSGFYAIRHIPLVDFYGIIFAIPIIITILSAVWLREHVGWRRWLAVGCGFAGVSVMLYSGAAAAPVRAVELGYFGAFGCAVFNAVSTVMVRRYGRGESNLTFSFYAGLCNVSVSGLLVLVFGWQGYAFWDGVATVGAGVLCGVGSVLLMTAFQHSPPAAVAPFQYTQMIWGAVLGYVIFHDVPTGATMIGAAIVIGSGWFTLWREARIAHAARKARRAAEIM